MADALSRIPVARVAVEIARNPSEKTDFVVASICAVLCVGYLAAVWSDSAWGYNTDGWFLLASGREILESGVPGENPWSYVGGLAIVIQQWAHDVWLCLWQSAFGFHGVGLSCALLAVVLIAFLWEFLPSFCSGGRPSIAALSASAFICVVCSAPYLNARPTVWSMLCLLATLAVCSRARNHPRLYAALPAITLAHVNLHGAMWALDAFAATCFLLPWDGVEWRARRKEGGLRPWIRSRGPLLLALAAMAAASLVNPYGIRGSFYCLLSIGEASYGGYIQEMRPFVEAVGFSGAILYAAMLFGPMAAAFVRNKTMPPAPAAAFLAAAMVATATHVRSVWILAIAAMACALAMARPAPAGRAARAGGAKAVAAACAVVIAASVVSLAGVGQIQDGAAGIGTGAISSWEDGQNGIAPLAEEVLASGIDRPKVYASLDVVYATLEFYGVPVVCDLRPEIWAPAVTGVEGYCPWREYCDATLGDGETLKRYIDEGDFDFYIVDAGSAGRYCQAFGLEVVDSAKGWTLLK